MMGIEMNRLVRYKKGVFFIVEWEGVNSTTGNLSTVEVERCCATRLAEETAIVVSYSFSSE
jgi:hypothetical protein